MAQSQSGKWVAKVGSTGGGKSYRSQRPTNFYAAIALIVIVGLLSIFFARHEYQNASATTSTTAVTPTVGSTSFAALAFDVCGKLQPSLAAATSTTTPLTAQADGVVKLTPKTAAEAGKNATVALFAKDYPGVTITSNELVLPRTAGTATGGSWTTGSTCAAGTPDAGKKGKVVISYWPNFATTKATQTTSDPAAVHFSANGLVTVGFVPEGATVLRPSSTTIQKMLVAAQSTATSPTTTAATGSTTPSAVTTTSASTTSTSGATTSTTAPSTTTTKK